MVQVRQATHGVDGVEQAEGQVIDRAHLRRMTFADSALEREVLGLFDKQAASMLELIPIAEPGALPALAHAVKGSARGIGAWRVAEAAAVLEMAPAGNRAPLKAALAEARAAIGKILAEVLPRN
jgi:HPt (histidine-containing phosphotransfer) domain-containing protein